MFPHFWLIVYIIIYLFFIQWWNNKPVHVSDMFKVFNNDKSHTDRYDIPLRTEAQMNRVWLRPLKLSEAPGTIGTSLFLNLETAERFLCVSETSAALQPTANSASQRERERERTDPALQTHSCSVSQSQTNTSRDTQLDLQKKLCLCRPIWPVSDRDNWF